MKNRHNCLEQLSLTSPLKRKFEPFPNDVQSVVAVDPGAEVVVACIVPDLSQYLEPRRGLDFRDSVVVQNVDQLVDRAGSREGRRLDERLHISKELGSPLLGSQLVLRGSLESRR